MDILLHNDTQLNESSSFETYYEIVPDRDFVGKFAVFYITLLATCIFSQKLSKCPEYLKETVLITFVNLTVLLLFPLIIVTYAVIVITRLFLIILFKLYYQDKLKLMDPQDVAWAIEKPYQCTNFTSLYILEGLCDVQDIQKRIETQLVNKRDEKGTLIYDRLRFSVVERYGFYCWEKCEKFRIENHVRLMDKSQHEYTEDEVFQGLSAISDIPMGADKPQWEILIVPKFVYLKDESRTGNYYGIIFRVHHSIMDGVSAGNALKYALADKPMKFSVNPLKGPNIHPLLLLFLHAKAYTLATTLLFKAMCIRDKNCFNHDVLTGPKTFGWSKPVCMNAVKKIRETCKTTTTAVFMNSLGGAIRNLAIKKNLPVPRSIYATPTIAMLPYPDTKPTNRFIIVHFPLEIGLPSRLERLQAANESAKKLAVSIEPLVYFLMLKLGGRLPVIMAKHILGQLDATMILSNVPGPSEDAYLFGGHKLVDSVFWVPLKNWSGIGAGLFSYAGKVRASFVGDGAALPDPTDVDNLLRGFETEILEMGKIAGLSPDQVFWKE